MKKRVILIVLDSVGVGAMPDAAEFGDAGTNTLGNIIKARGGLKLPNLYSLGICGIEGAMLPPYDGAVLGCFGKAAERTKAKDTTSGHWEIAGLTMQTPFKTFPNGFPPGLMGEFERRIGRGTLGNVVASGTEIIKQLGDEHVATGYPIVYTSADSVFQIAAHEDIIPLKELYAICESAREMLVGEYLVGRVIARPFLGRTGDYKRTQNRRDFTFPPPKDTILDALSAAGKCVVGIGKIEDIFARRGLSKVDHTTNNHDGIEATLRLIKSGEGDFIFTNLVDFDMLFGHRNDVDGYADALEYFDVRLGEILSALKEGDLLIITADHGCDPTTPGTDHTREYIPIVLTGAGFKTGVNIGERKSFADIGAAVYEYLLAKTWREGESFLELIAK